MDFSANKMLAYLCILLLTGITQSLQVEEELTIEVVENGTVEAIKFDCPYSLNESELGLAVKWFFRDSHLPFYQWIVGRPPSAMGMFIDRLDLDYEASEDPNHKHSGLRILNPTTEVSGDYRCQASTFEEELEIPRKLVVYSKPSNVEIWTQHEGEDHVRVFCKIRDIYPEPEVTFHKMSEKENDRDRLEGLDIVKSWDDNLYHAMVEVLVLEKDLEGPTHFECEVTIPHTKVLVTNKTHYEPRVKPQAEIKTEAGEGNRRKTKIDDGDNIKTEEVKSGSEEHSAMAVVVSLAFLAIWRF